MAVENSKPPRPRTRQTVTFRMLCVIAREQIVDDLTIGTGEWAARIKDRLARLNFTEPNHPEQLTAAMAAAEQALRREGHTRSPRPSASPSEPITSGPLTREEAEAIAKPYLEQQAGLIKRMPNVRPLTLRETERKKALKIFAQGILEQVKRCEEAETTDPDPSKVPV